MKIWVVLFAVVSTAVSVPQFKPYNRISYEPGSIQVKPIDVPIRTPITRPVVPVLPVAPIAPLVPVSPPRYINPIALPVTSVPAPPLPQPQPLPVHRVSSVQNIPREDSGKWIIIKQVQDHKHDGPYQYSYETENGIVVQESSVQLNPGTNEEVKAAQGSYSYTGQDGILYTVTYTADENGFQPQGVHLPVGPPIPDLILRALEYNRAHPEEDDL